MLRGYIDDDCLAKHRVLFAPYEGELDNSVIALPAEIELADESVRTLQMYLAGRWKDTAELWPSRQADRMSTESVRNVVRDAAVAADVRPMTVAGRGRSKT